ncbi:YcxB family protein [Actinoplanes sp. NPDC051411]|uniref:YcxB family protein n=1 Tax=Actinoplanes sp. NPDC051411 TaxID=3155522 RepID=UPI003415946D
MHVEFTFVRSAEFFRRQLSPFVSQKLAFTRTAALVAVFASVAVPIATQGSREGIDFGVALLIMGGLLLAGALRRRNRMLRIPGSMLAECRWLLTDDRLELGTPDTLTRLSWSRLRLARVLPDAYVLAAAEGVSVGIPREPLSPADDAQLRALLDRLPIVAAAPLPAEPLAGDRTPIVFTSSQPALPVGARLRALRRRALRPAGIESAAAGFVLLAAGWIAGTVLDDPILVGLGVSLGGAALVVAVLAWLLGRPAPRVPVGEPRRFTITDQAMRADGGGRSIRWNWSVVTRLEEWPETYVLYEDERAQFPIPRDTLTPQQEQDLRVLLDERGLPAVDGRPTVVRR